MPIKFMISYYPLHMIQNNTFYSFNFCFFPKYELKYEETDVHPFITYHSEDENIYSGKVKEEICR